FAVTKVTPGNPDAATAQERAMLEQQLAQAAGNEDARGMLQSLRKRMKITVAESRLWPRRHTAAMTKPGIGGLFHCSQAVNGSVDPGHPHGAVAGVDVGDFAGDAGRQVRAHEGGGVADVLDGDVAAQRRGGFEGA